MKGLPEERTIRAAEYIIKKGATVRTAAKEFGVSKSTVHKDVTETLRHVNPALWESVAEVLAQNKNERHLRGGEATRRRHLAHGGRKDREDREEHGSA
jgi:putative DeoR family transcriptional regulator (stage III sporulation protein D)